MKGVRFYEEFVHKRRKVSARNVIALIVANGRDRDGWEAVAGLYDHPDSHVASTGTSNEFLRRNCRRVSETKARAIHPNLFRYLDYLDKE